MPPRRTLAALLLLAAAARAEVLHVPKDFATIQAAVDAAVDGDTVLIASGTYAEQVVVDQLDDFVIRGQGKVELVGPADGAGLAVTNCAGVRVERLRFRDVGAAVTVSLSEAVTVSRCRGEEIGEAGFVVSDSLGVLLERCIVDGSGDGGVQINGTIGGALRRCTIRNVGYGLDINGATALELERVVVEHASNTGLSLDAASTGVKVIRSRWRDAVPVSVQVAGAGNSLSQCVIVEPGHGVEMVLGSSHNVLDRVRVVGGVANSFRLGGSAQELRDCRSSKSGGAGLFLLGDGQHLVQDSRFLGGSDSSVIIEDDVDGCSLLGNRVLKTLGTGVHVGGNQSLLSGNVVNGSTGDGIVIASTFNMVTGNKAHGSGGFDLNELSASDSVFLDNSFGTVQQP